MSYVQERLAEIARANEGKPPVEKRVLAKDVKPEAPKPRARGKQGHIYCISRDLSTVKIGFASDVRKRLHDLQTANPDKLEIQASFPAFELCETLIHERFHEDNIRGEWFELTEDIEDFLDDITDYHWQVLGQSVDEDREPMTPEVLSYILSTIGQRWDLEHIRRLANE